MMKQVLFGTFYLIFVIHQSTAAPPNYQRICDGLKAMFQVFQNVGQVDHDERIKIAFEKGLTDYATSYNSNFSRFNQAVTHIAGEYDSTFFDYAFYVGNNETQAKLKRAIQTYLNLFVNNFDGCPGYAKLLEIKNHIETQPPLLTQELTAAPSYSKVCQGLRTMLNVFQQVGQTVHDQSIKATFERDLSDRRKNYERNFYAFNLAVNELAREYDETFSEQSFYASQRRIQGALKDAIQAYFDLFGTNTNACPGYEKISEIKRHIETQPPLFRR